MLNFIGSLHNHTDFSNIRLPDSINKVETLIDYAIELGHEVIAITEHETTSNSIKVEKYYKKVKKDHPDFKVILGNEIYLCRNGLNADNFVSGKDKYYHFILLAKDAIGHKQIRTLSTRAWQRSYMSGKMRRVPTYYSDLEEVIGSNPGHVIGSTACIGGALGSQLLNYKNTKDEALYQQIINWCFYIQNIFGKDNFYLEMQPSATKEQEYVNKQILSLSKQLDIPYIITCDAHYLNKDKASIHEAYLNSKEGDREVKSFYATTYLMNTEEVESYMKGYMSTEDFQYAYKNILDIKEKCEDYSLMKPLKIPSLKWKVPSVTIIPDFYYNKIPYLHTFMESDFEGDQILARAIVEKLMADSTLQNEETFNEVNSNLEMTWISSQVNKAHWSAYFLNLQKIIDVCWEAGTIVGPGRGSGVGFLLLYILGITQINPLREKTKTFAWRFLNPQRVSVLDVDFDISGLKRNQVLEAFRKEYGADRVSNVATFSTEKSKSAILTAARGLEINNDLAQYIASLIPADRGITRTLKQCYYGDKENDFAPISTFVKEMDENPDLWEVAQEIEGLVKGIGSHAGGVIFVDEPFENSTALMKTPDGTVVTQYDLHDSESVSLIKYDALSVKGMDRIQLCLEFLIKYKYVEPEATLRETYEKVLGIYNIERDDPEMWKMTWDHKIQSLFQMEQQSGIQGIALTHPESVDDLATLNSVIRLMGQEKNAEPPLNKYARFKNNINLWYQEMDSYGLTKDEQKVLEPIVKISYGMCEAQERFMQLVQLPECGGFDLAFADKLRKSIAKKNPAAYLELEKEFFAKTAEKGCSKNLCNYVWKVLIATSRGYGFKQN